MPTFLSSPLSLACSVKTFLIPPKSRPIPRLSWLRVATHCSMARSQTKTTGTPCRRNEQDDNSSQRRSEAASPGAWRRPKQTHTLFCLHIVSEKCESADLVALPTSQSDRSSSTDGQSIHTKAEPDNDVPVEAIASAPVVCEEFAGLIYQCMQRGVICLVPVNSSQPMCCRRFSQVVGCSLVVSSNDISLTRKKL